MVKTIVMPKLGTTMREGVIGAWHKEIGDHVEAGELLLSIENNKADVDVESPATGYFVHKFADSGDEMEVGLTIGLIADSMDEDITFYLENPNAEYNPADVTNSKTKEKDAPAEEAAPAAAPAPKREGRLRIIPKARIMAKKLGIDPETVVGTGPDGVITPRDIEKASKAAPKASPLAKVVAEKAGVDLKDVKGTGVDGKIMKRDIPAPAPVAAAEGDVRKPFTGMRRVIADNMYRSVQTMAQTFLRVNVDMTNAKKLRSYFKDDGLKVSFNDIIAKAVAKALVEHPNVNASIDGNEIVLHKDVNIGFAVALDDGLIVPNVKGVQNLTIPQISAASKELVEKAKSSSLSKSEYTGATFTISNLGMYDIDDFVAIINPPEAAILAVGKIEDRPVCTEDGIVACPMVTLCLSYDHMLIDGAPAAAFLKRVKQFLERPCLML